MAPAKQPTPSQLSALRQANLQFETTPNGRVWCIFAAHSPDGAFAKYYPKDGKLEFSCGSTMVGISPNDAISVILTHNEHHRHNQQIRDAMMQNQKPTPPPPMNGHHAAYGYGAPWQTPRPGPRLQEQGPGDDIDDDDDDDADDRHTPQAPVHLVWDLYMRLVAENSCPPEAMTEEQMARLADMAIEAASIFFNKLHESDPS